LIRPSQLSESCFASECLYHIEQDFALVKLERSYPVMPLRPCSGTSEGFIFVAYDPPTEAIVMRPVLTFFTPEPREGKHSTTFLFEWDGPVNPGNSGAPLIGPDGGVAGVISGISKHVESSEDVGGAGGRGRAIYVGPLMGLYLKWKLDPDSIPPIHVPFTGYGTSQSPSDFENDA
jgi:hypothetical protein